MMSRVTGDPLLTRAQMLAFGFNARGRSETDPLHVRLQHRFPAAFASFRKQAGRARIKPGQLWTWRESEPQLLFLAVRETPFGITRARYVEAIALTLARDYRLYGIRSLAIAPLHSGEEWAVFQQALETWLAPIRLPVVLYSGYEAGIQAPEGLEGG